MSIFRKLWPFARKAVKVEIATHISTHPHLLRAITALEKGDIEEALEAIADFVQESKHDYALQTTLPHPGVLNLLESVETSLRTASFEWYASFK